MHDEIEPFDECVRQHFADPDTGEVDYDFYGPDIHTLRMGYNAAKTEIARLRQELDASCNAEELRQVREERDRLRELLLRARKFVEDDTLMIAAITRHAPLPPDAQAIHNSTEYLSEILLREIDSVLPNA